MDFEDISTGMLLNFQWYDDPYYVIYKCSSYFRVHRINTGAVYNLSPLWSIYFMPFPRNRLYP